VKGENPVHAALSRLRSINGLVSATLVDPDSAQALETVVAGTGIGSTPADPAAVTLAAGASDVVQVIGLMAAGLADPDGLEDVIITLGRRHHLITPVPAGIDGLIVVVTLDRSRTNLALARLQLQALGPLLATASASGPVS